MRKENTNPAAMPETEKTSGIVKSIEIDKGNDEEHGNEEEFDGKLRKPPVSPEEQERKDTGQGLDKRIAR